MKTPSVTAASTTVQPTLTPIPAFAGAESWLDAGEVEGVPAIGVLVEDVLDGSREGTLEKSLEEAPSQVNTPLMILLLPARLENRSHDASMLFVLSTVKAPRRSFKEGKAMLGSRSALFGKTENQGKGFKQTS